MAEKTVAVKLTARIDAYKRGMADAKRSTSDFTAGSSRDLTQLGSSMSNVGKTATLGLTLPLVGVGAASVKMSNDFDASMAKIVGLVGLSTNEVDGMKEAVLGLAGSTAKAPQELADALFVVTSAGLRGEEALNTLEAAAKASTAGLGDTGDIARAVAGAVNAYGEDVLSAAHATDVLTATARGGNFETSQLAGSLGKVLPFAKQAQVSFEDVGGAVALLTRTNGNAAESITQVSGLMRAFVVPSAEAKKILDDLGLSAADIRDSMGENGLVETLRMLDEKLGGNREQLGKLIGRAEGTSAAFQILDADAASLEGTFGVTANAAGMVGEAFDAAAGTDAFKMQKAMNDIKVAMVEIGAIIGPIVADVVSGVAGMASAFSDLDPTLQKIVIGVAAVAAAAGPLLIITGSLIRNYALLRTTMAASNGTMIGGAAKLGLIAQAAVVAAAAFASFRAPVAGLSGDVDYLYRDVSLLEKPMQQLGKLSYMLAGGTESAESKAAKFDKTAADMYGTMTSGVSTMGELTARLREQGVDYEIANRIIIAYRKELDDASGVTDDAADAADGLTDSLTQQDAARAANHTATVLSAQALEEEERATVLATEAMRDEARAADWVATTLGATTRETDALAAAARIAAQRIEDIEDAFASLDDQMSDRSAWLDVEDAADDFEDAITKAEEATKEFGAESREAEQANRDMERSLIGRIQSIKDYVLEAENIPEEEVTEIFALLDQGSVDEAEAIIRELERHRTMVLSIQTRLRGAPPSTYATPDRNDPGRTVPAFHDGGVIGGPLGSEQLILAKGGETVLPTHKGMPGNTPFPVGLGGGGHVSFHIANLVTQARDGQQLLDEFTAAVRRQGPTAIRQSLGV